MSALKMIAVGRKLSNIYTALCLPVCKRYGLNQTSFDILLFLANNPQYHTARNICTVRGIKSGLVSVAVESLIRSGYLARAADPADRRRVILSPTAAAAPIIRDGRAVQRNFTDTLKTDITDAELSAFERIADKLAANLERF